MDYEYKCVGAPERPKRSRRAKTASDRVARAMEDIIREEAINGWEYLRTDLVPVSEKSSFLGRVQEVHRAVLVFRRDLEARRERASERSRRESSSELINEAAARRSRPGTAVEETPEPLALTDPVLPPQPIAAPPPKKEPAAAAPAPRSEPVAAKLAAAPAATPAPAPAAAPAPTPAPAPAPAPEVQDRPRRGRAVPADEPFFQALEKATNSQRKDRSPPSGLG